tara:strand:+ start:1206 stop:1349 length:144 start_codon:yes stop_codon:yes gene_type:complete
MNEIFFSIGLVLVVIIATSTFVLFGLAGGFSNLFKTKKKSDKDRGAW